MFADCSKTIISEGVGGGITKFITLFGVGKLFPTWGGRSRLGQRADRGGWNGGGRNGRIDKSKGGEELF